MNRGDAGPDGEIVAEFAVSRWRSAGLTLASIAFVLGGGAMAFGFMPNVRPGSFGQFIGYAGIIFFTPLIPLWLWMTFLTEPVVSVGAQGLRDLRISPDWIPWSAIEAMHVRQVQRTKHLALTLDSAFAEQMQLAFVPRLFRRTLGLSSDGPFSIAMAGLKGSFADLMTAITIADPSTADSMN